MKVTVEPLDSLHRSLEQQAAGQGVPTRSPATEQFRLKSITTDGRGLACKQNWVAIRSLIYEGHGG